MSLYDELRSLTDIEELIEKKIRESEILEYKTADDKAQDHDKNKAATALAAFANSAGGVLIYGMETNDKKDPERPTKVVGVTNWTSSYLQRHARDTVRHPIPGIRVKAIPMDEDRQILLFDVPTSPIAPHQLAADNVYYHRQGADSKPMSHDLVELYFGRRMHSKLEPILSATYGPGPSTEPRRVVTHMTISHVNRGGQIGREVLTRITSMPNRVFAFQVERHRFVIPAQESESGEGKVLSIHHIKELFYPGIPVEVVTVNFNYHEGTHGQEKPLMFIDIYAADARPHRYRVFREPQYPENPIRWVEDGLPPQA